MQKYKMSYVIAIDGTDASGKKTQSELLKERLEKEGYAVRLLSFPDYDSPSSSLVKMYLNGEFGDDPDSTNAYCASAFFAVDRYASFKTDWEKDYLSEDTVIILNRYTTSNAIHQLSKIDDDYEKEKFLKWLYDFEFVKFSLPVPDMTVYLDMPLDVSEKLLEKRCESDNVKKDIHEKSSLHLEKSRNAALFATEKWGWKHLLCAENNQPLSIEDIHKKIYSLFRDNVPSGFELK